MRDHFAFVWRSARRLGLPEHAADDATQQVFVVLARRLDGVVVGAEKAFLYRTTAHVVAELKRSHARRSARIRSAEAGDVVADHGLAPDEALEQKRARALLARALAALDDELREVLVLFALEGIATQEIAGLVGIPQGTVASRLRRARQRLMRAARSIEVAGLRR